MNALMFRAVALLAVLLTTTGRTLAQRISNIAIRAETGPEAPLVTGFTISAGPKTTVLVRAVGPGLNALGVSDTLADPKLDGQVAHFDQIVLIHFTSSGRRHRERTRR